jgi:GH25 family lysozyme M1 (1,4-beta-N-acetylmuramidase)
MGPDLCYHFAYFTLNRQQFLVDIHAIGTYPTKPTACPLAIYYKDTTLSIQANAVGKYVLRFYNGTQLFKADTVQVN